MERVEGKDDHTSPPNQPGGHDRSSPQFRRLWMSRAASNLSDGLALGMLPLLVANVTRSPFLIAIASVALYLPWLVVGPGVGVFVDRRSRPLTMLRSDSARVLLFSALGLAVYTRPDSAIWLVPISAAVIGALEVVSDTAASAHIPQLVDANDLEWANGRLAGTELVMNAFIGPALGAGLFTLWAPLPVFLQAGLMAISVLLLMGLDKTAPPERPGSAEGESILAETLGGFRSIGSSPTLRLIVPSTGLLAFAFGMSAGVLVLHLVENTNFSEAGYGIVWSVAAIGGTAAAFLMADLPGRLGRAAVLLGSAALIAGSLYAVAGVSNGWLVAVAFAALAAGQELWNLVSVAHRQRVTPAYLLGRVSAASRMIALGALPLGGIAAGLLAEALSIRTVIVIAGLVALSSLALTAPVARRLDGPEAELR